MRLSISTPLFIEYQANEKRVIAVEIKLIEFEEHGDERGTLIALEQGKNIPFEIKRVYYMFETTPNTRRGFHAHKRLRQVLICVHGSCIIHLDDGAETAEVPLTNPDIGLMIDSAVWREMYDFSDDAVLMVLASELYDESDYIRDYNEFLEYVNE